MILKGDWTCKGRSERNPATSCQIWEPSTGVMLMKDRGFGWTVGMCVGTVIVAVIALGMFFQQRRTNAQLQAALTARANGQWVAADHDTTSRAERNEGLSQAEKKSS